MGTHLTKGEAKPVAPPYFLDSTTVRPYNHHHISGLDVLVC